MNDAGKCQISSQDWLTIANVANGETLGEAGQAVVLCSVRAQGAGFHVKARIAAGPQASISIEGDVTTAQSIVQGVFAKSGTTFEQTDCTIAYTTPAMGIAAGRIWGNLTCAHATSATPAPAKTCLAAAELKFENCAQEPSRLN